jgi:hypothetical protein
MLLSDIFLKKSTSYLLDGRNYWYQSFDGTISLPIH